MSQAVGTISMFMNQNSFFNSKLYFEKANQITAVKAMFPKKNRNTEIK